MFHPIQRDIHYFYLIVDVVNIKFYSFYLSYVVHLSNIQ